MTIVIVVAVVVLWVIVGLAARVSLLRGGHWHMSGPTAAFMGPFVIVALVSVRQQPRRTDARAVAVGEPAGGPVDTLVGIDPSPEARAALVGAVDMLGPRIGRLVIATVLPSGFRDAGERQSAEADALKMLEESRAELESKVESVDGLAADLVLLRGNPADALVEYANDEGITVIAVGKRGTGLAKTVLGSVASNLARDARSAVLIFGH
jgi:nucleotide-binding universal stress UspA family protein